MRLENYLNESMTNDPDEIVKLIEKNCRPFLKEFKTPMYRGISSGEMFLEKNVRSDRMTTHSDPELSERWDEMFKEKFGWKPRSEGSFCTRDKVTSSIYGTPYYFFPIGSYKYIYSENIVDLYHILINKEVRKMTDDEIYEYISYNYKDSRLGKNLGVNNEVMFKCNSYYALKCSTENDVILSMLGIKI